MYHEAICFFMLEYDSNKIGTSAPIVNWVNAMEEALTESRSGHVFVPQRSHIEHDGNTFILMPCIGKEYFSTKLISEFPGNAKKKKPVIYGTVVLNDGKTGEPLAVFDGGKLTAMRTAAVGSAAIKHLAPENAEMLGIIGLGIQGLHQAIFACNQRPIKKLRIYDFSDANMTLFGERFKAFYPHVEVIKCRTNEELCEDSEIIITATNSKKPVIPDRESCWKHKTIVGIGSYRPDMKEIPDAIFREINQLFVDTMHAISESGDLIEPLSKGLIIQEQIYSLADVVEKTIIPVGRTRLFKSVGMAAFDLYGAMLVYKKGRL